VRIGLISDTHGCLDSAVFRHFEQCDEVWHASDFGVEVAELVAALNRSAVYVTSTVTIKHYYPQTLAGCAKMFQY